jgi:hypothetical protein
MDLNLREIDKRVAVELGWSDIYEPQDLGMGYDVVGTHPQGDQFPIPKYSKDAIYAEVVRQEIERRGWTWWLWKNKSPKKGWVATVDIEPHFEYYGESTYSPHIALCLAFLAACDGERMVSNGSTL